MDYHNTYGQLMVVGVCVCVCVGGGRGGGGGGGGGGESMVNVLKFQTFYSHTSLA